MAHGSKKRIFHEYLNANFGYFYTIRKTLYRGRTRFQNIDLVDSHEFGTTLQLDGITQVMEKGDSQYHEPMVHPAMCCHARPRSVLVIGGGDGGVLREVLKYRSVQSVDFAELDSEVVNFSRKYLSAVHRGAFDDPRVRTHFMDGRAFVEGCEGGYDVVVMDMTDPLGPSKMLYTREFFRAVKRSFRNRQGVFAMHSVSPVACPVTHNCILKTLRTVYKHVNVYYLYVQMYGTLWSIAVSSDAVDVFARSAATIDAWLRRRSIRGLKVFNGASHRAMLTPFPYVERVHRGPGRVITDKAPHFPDNPRPSL